MTRDRLDVIFVVGRRSKSRCIKKAPEEYPGIVHCLRIAGTEDLDDNLPGQLQGEVP
jgi:hypothetical protein